MLPTEAADVSENGIRYGSVWSDSICWWNPLTLDLHIQWYYSYSTCDMCKCSYSHHLNFCQRIPMWLDVVNGQPTTFSTNSDAGYACSVWINKTELFERQIGHVQLCATLMRFTHNNNLITSAICFIVHNNTNYSHCTNTNEPYTPRWTWIVLHRLVSNNARNIPMWLSLALNLDYVRAQRSPSS